MEENEEISHFGNEILQGAVWMSLGRSTSKAFLFCSRPVLSLTNTDKNLQWTANWTAKRRFQGLTATFLMLIFFSSPVMREMSPFIHSCWQCGADFYYQTFDQIGIRIHHISASIFSLFGPKVSLKVLIVAGSKGVLEHRWMTCCCRLRPQCDLFCREELKHLMGVCRHRNWGCSLRRQEDGGSSAPAAMLLLCRLIFWSTCCLHRHADWQHVLHALF